MWLMKWESRTTPLTCTEAVQEQEPRSPEVLCTFVCVNGWMRERGRGFEHVCCRSLCLCVCLCICIQCAGSACVCVLCVHSMQHTPRLWQTDSKPRNPHTPLPRLIVHEIRTFGLQNAPTTPPLAPTPPSMGNWVLWLFSLRQLLQRFGSLRGNSMSNWRCPRWVHWET